LDIKSVKSKNTLRAVVWNNFTYNYHCDNVLFSKINGVILPIYVLVCFALFLWYWKYRL